MRELNISPDFGLSIHRVPKLSTGGGSSLENITKMLFFYTNIHPCGDINYLVIGGKKTLRN